MATDTSSISKRNSLHKLSNILQLASPSFSRPSFDSQRTRTARNRLPGAKAYDSHSCPVSPRSHNSTLAPIASIISTNSVLSTSHAPLLDHRRPNSPEPSQPFPVPVTTNDLAAEEKMKLVKKSRKISRVLGEVPILATKESDFGLHSPQRLSEVWEDSSGPSPSISRPTSPAMNMHTVSASAKMAFRRSLTFAGKSSLQVQEVHRSKSISTLRPSLHVSTSMQEGQDVSRYSPIVFAPSEFADALEDDLPQFISPSLINVSEDIPLSPPLQTHGKDLTVTSTLPAEESRERVERQRMERLARRLGDNIPPDVLLRAASPSQQSNSEMYRIREASHVVSVESLPQRSSSLRAKLPQRRQRPQSLDIKNARDLGVAPITATNSSHAGPIRRTKSVRSTRDERITNEDSQMVKEASPQSPGLHDPLTEKQRILNVKRAKKLTQLFGDNPPMALFQITNFGHLVEGGDSVSRGSSDGLRQHRDSLATIISISSHHGSAGQKLRDSFISVVTSSSDLSAMLSVADQSESAKISQTIETAARPSLTALDEPRTASAQSTSYHAPIVAADTNPTPAHERIELFNSGPVLSRPTSPDCNLLAALAEPAPTYYLPSTPPTLPPFSNFMSSSKPLEFFIETQVETMDEPVVSVEPLPEEFQARRRRAAKLSKFFGVEVNSLVDHLPSEATPSRSTRASVQHLLPHAPSSNAGAVKDSTYVPSVTVAKTRGRYAYQGNVEELDMSQVIDKLRKMKSS
ncbi:hypothetical protein BC835DRAFT_1410244 [Cytidiella melzeri]|nr:hypothetical protein BC835DRAFT_1410244 [Cytidiella melzeri]